MPLVVAEGAWHTILFSPGDDDELAARSGPHHPLLAGVADFHRSELASDPRVEDGVENGCHGHDVLSRKGDRVLVAAHG